MLASCGRASVSPEFANGAKTMAFLQMFAEASKYYEDQVGRKADPLPGENRKGQTAYDPDLKTGCWTPKKIIIAGIAGDIRKM